MPRFLYNACKLAQLPDVLVLPEQAERNSLLCITAHCV
jgi:hypothetical protein